VVGELHIILSKLKERLETAELERSKVVTVVRGDSPSQATTASSTYCT